MQIYSTNLANKYLKNRLLIKACNLYLKINKRIFSQEIFQKNESLKLKITNLINY